MPAAVTLWQVRLTTTTGDPADDVVNTYHVQYLNGYDSTKLTATKTALLNFTSNVASIIAPSTVPTPLNETQSATSCGSGSPVPAETREAATS